MAGYGFKNGKLVIYKKNHSVTLWFSKFLFYLTGFIFYGRPAILFLRIFNSVCQKSREQTYHRYYSKGQT